MCLKIGVFLNANGFFGCVVDEKIVRFGRKLEAEVFHNKDEPGTTAHLRARFHGSVLPFLATDEHLHIHAGFVQLRACPQRRPIEFEQLFEPLIPEFFSADICCAVDIGIDQMSF